MPIWFCKNCKATRASNRCEKCGASLSMLSEETVSISDSNPLDTVHTQTIPFVLATPLIKIPDQIVKSEETLNKNPSHLPSLYTMAKWHHSKGELSTAKSYLKTILSLSENHIEATKLIADIFFKLNQFKSAILSLKKLSRLTPDNYLVFLNLGLCYIHRNDLKSAESVLQKAEELCPTQSKDFLLIQNTIKEIKKRGLMN